MISGSTLTITYPLLVHEMVAIIYRMIVCAERTLDDFYVIVHEMGHIHYYMAYEMQPPIFRVRKFFRFYVYIHQI